MRLQKRYKKYYIVFSVLCILLLVGMIAGYKIFLQKPTYIYVKVKVNQGLWWAITQKPPFWYAEGIHIGDTAYDFLRNPEAQILDKRTYLQSENDVFDIYVTLKLKVNKQAASYTYNRSVVSVGAPLEVQFPRETVSGTIIGLSNIPFSENLIEKTIYVTKPNAYLWEYDAIEPGSTLSDGKQIILTILDKNREDASPLLSSPNGTITLNTIDQGRVTIKAKIKVKKAKGVYVLGEEQIIMPGRPLTLSLSSFVLKDFIVSKIE